MIKKSIFADEIANSMQQQLQPLTKKASIDVSQAADYLNQAAEIFEEVGFIIQAKQVDDILYKISESKRQKLPGIKTLMDAGLSQKDFEDFGKGSQFAKAKVNKALKDAGYQDHEIAHFIGKHNMIPEKDIDELTGPDSSLNRLLKMIENPHEVAPSSKLNPGDEVVINSLATDKATKGLTPDKMVKNLLHHGTEFNMNDDNLADDLLNLEINDAELEVGEKDPHAEMDFEDEV